MVYLVFYIQELCHDQLITICSTEAIAHDLGTSYTIRLYAGWLDEWEKKHNRHPAWEPRSWPRYKVVPVKLDRRELAMILTRN